MPALPLRLLEALALQDILQMGLQDLRRAVPMIPQEPVLFQDRKRGPAKGPGGLAAWPGAPFGTCALGFGSCKRGLPVFQASGPAEVFRRGPGFQDAVFVERPRTPCEYRS